jgi:uncharacterized phage protein gp47/JayE
MAYFAPYISDNGINIPTYTDILNELKSQAQAIFGADVYLENDSQDYQWIAINARAISDSLNALVIAYNQRDPRAAIGAGLSGVVRVNGIARNPATYSECVVKVSGTAGTVITAGIVQDVSLNQWYLPPVVTIPSYGYIYATAICATSGAVTALIGDINAIVTPTFGWDSVINEQAATPGAETETDAALRARQKLSTSLPSQSILEGTLGAILDLDGVTRARVYENDTNITDSNGITANKIAPVIEGGDSTDIVNAIYYKKNPGCGTFGTSSEDVIDSYGNITTIRYTVPTYVDVRVTVTIKMLVGYSSAYADAIKAKLVEYLNLRTIGEDITNSSLMMVSLSALDSVNNPVFSVLGVVAAEGAGSQTMADVVVAFDKVASGQLGYMVVVET